MYKVAVNIRSNYYEENITNGMYQTNEEMYVISGIGRYIVKLGSFSRIIWAAQQ